MPVSCIEPSSPIIAVSAESKNEDGGDLGALRGPLLVRSVGGLGGGGGRGRRVGERGPVLGGAGLVCCGFVVPSTKRRFDELLRYGPEPSNIC